MLLASGTNRAFIGAMGHLLTNLLVKAPTDVLALLTQHEVWARLTSAVRQGGTAATTAGQPRDVVAAMSLQTCLLGLFGIAITASQTAGLPRTIPAQILRSPGMTSAALHAVTAAAGFGDPAVRRASILLASHLLEFLSRALAAYTELHKPVWDFVLPEVRKEDEQRPARVCRTRGTCYAFVCACMCWTVAGIESGSVRLVPML